MGGNDMVYIAICDEDATVVSMLNKKVHMYLEQRGVMADITVYTEGKLFQYDIKERKYFDLILSDVEMPDLNGIELTKSVKKYLSNVLVIFITLHMEYVLDAFELSIFRYISKDLIDEKLPKALDDAIRVIHLQSKRCYTVCKREGVERIPYDRIVYIQRETKHSLMVLKDGRVVKVRKSLAQIYKELENDDFFYVNRGNIVNLNYVVEIKKEMVRLENNVCLPASSTKLDQLKKRFNIFGGELQ